MAAPKTPKSKAVSKPVSESTIPKAAPKPKPTPVAKPVPKPKSTPVAKPKPAPVLKSTPPQRYDIARVLDACRKSYYATVKLNEHAIQMASGSTKETLKSRCNNTLYVISSYYDNLLKLDHASKLPKTTAIEESVFAVIQDHLNRNAAYHLEIDTTPLNHTSF